jgi:predicted RNase H-like HicB family nuclease
MMARAPSLSEDRSASYRVSLVRTGEGPAATWVAEVDELPNLSARAPTPEEAVRRVWAAASGLPGAAQDSADETKTAARHSGKLLVRMPATLHDELAAAAEREGVSLNQLITGVLAASVEWRAADATPARESWFSGRLTPIALAANLTVVLIAAIVAITVLVIAWRGT